MNALRSTKDVEYRWIYEHKLILTPHVCVRCVLVYLSLPGVLADLSERGDTESRTGLASVVSEISLALARKQVDWIASASELEHFNNRNTERAEATFSQYAVRLRTKVLMDVFRRSGVLKTCRTIYSAVDVGSV